MATANEQIYIECSQCLKPSHMEHHKRQLGIATTARQEEFEYFVPENSSLFLHQPEARSLLPATAMNISGTNKHGTRLESNVRSAHPSHFARNIMKGAAATTPATLQLLGAVCLPGPTQRPHGARGEQWPEEGRTAVPGKGQLITRQGAQIYTER